MTDTTRPGVQPGDPRMLPGHYYARAAAMRAEDIREGRQDGWLPHLRDLSKGICTCGRAPSEPCSLLGQ